MIDKYKDYFKKITLETAKLSTCISKQVGAVLVRDNRIIAIGYNGVPSGKKHCNEIFQKGYDREAHHIWSQTHEYHAEENLLLFCLREGISTKDCSMFISLSPCINCSKLIANSGIKKVYFIEQYDKDIACFDFLKNQNIEISQI